MTVTPTAELQDTMPVVVLDLHSAQTPVPQPLQPVVPTGFMPGIEEDRMYTV